MSIKKYFDVASSIKSLAGTTAQKISSQVESVGYHEQDIIKAERYIPQADYSVPQGFARYGNAKDYYTQAIQRIYNTFPYDGSLKERLEWENESTYLDLYIYNDRYPRTNGYINFAAGGWGTPTALSPNGYGIPASSTNYEYIYVKGGPNQNPNGETPYRAQFTGSNYYEPSKNRASNLALNVNSRGVSLEFWLKKKAFNDTKTQKEVIFDLWNGITSSATNYARLRLELTSATGRRDGLAVGESPFLLTLYSGSTGFFQQRVATTTITTTGSVADSLWHHYAVTIKQDSAVTTRFYVDGRLNLEQHVSASGKGTLQNISGRDLRANIGALVTSPRKWTTATYAGKLSASLDEFRFWKTERTGQEIGRFWFTQVGGGVNTDPEPFIETEVSANLDLGVYFKFNEGITNTASVDSAVLDYSGRFSNGAWTCPAITAGNFSLARNTGSAIVLSNAATLEYKDPIIYPQHASVKALTTVLEATGSTYDVNNNASIYNTLPSWIIEEDNDGDGELRKLTQIISSYFDTLHLQIKDLNTIKDVGYVSGSNKPLPFAEKLLNSAGLVAPEIFLDADVLNVLASRSEDKVFEKPLEEIKNIIYKNIYNNLVYIFKSKGTEKSFRNLIRCFGIDDELVKLNMYANNVQFELRSNRRNVAVADRFVNFNTGDNKSGVVYNYRDPSNSQSAGYLSASAALADGHAITLESEVLFPLKSVPADDVYIDTNTISSSLFGVHGVQAAHAGHSDGLTTWATNDIVNFQVYAVRDEATSDNVRFVVTSSSPRGKVPYLTSELYEDVYNNTRWNLALRIKPEKYPLTSLVQGAELDPSRTTGSYTVELHGVQGESGEILQEFTVSKTINAPLHFITGSRRVYVGAHRTNFTGSLLSYSDVKVNACRFWLDYVDNAALAGHILDTQNFGTTHPHWFAYPFNPSSSYGDIQKADTLVFNWEFLTNTGSAATGRFTVPDLTSGSLITSTNALTASYGALGKIINPQYTARGDLFATSSTTVIDKDFVISSKLNLPENLKSEEMIQVLNATDQDVFTPDSRPTNYSFAFEKSMYQVISEEMINYFATLSDFHNLIGDPVNQWRPEYKSIDFMRQKFFETVENKELDFDKFYQYYKWFDSSLSVLLAQLAPVSADVATDVRTVIENHILERPKYQRKFPFLAKSDTNYPTGRIDGGMAADKTAQASPDEFPAGTSFFTNTAFTRRQIGSSNTPRTRPWKHFHAPRVDTNTPLAKSFLFDGTDEYVDIGSFGTWEALIGGAAGAAKEYSVSLWFKPAALVAANPYIYSFGARDRNMFIYGASLGAAKLHASNRSNSQNLAQTATGVLTAGTWYHLTVTFGGGTTGLTTIYIDGADATDVQNTTGTPDEIVSYNARIGAADTAASYTPGNMCDFAVWDKELSSAEVSEIYGDAQRVNLKEVSVTSNLIAWWMLGADPRDTYNGTIYDQIGTLNGTPTNFDSAADIELDSPVFKIPYYGSTGVNKNMYWHRYMELSALTGSKLTSRSKLYQSISQSFYRRTNSPVKFGVEGTTAVAGVGKHHNAVVNYVFSAARAWTGKKLVSSGSTVEELIPTTDVYYPSLKQRLGFGVSGSVNEAVSGPRHAPFSLYSSSVTTGYNAEVVANYASGVLITNLHNDFVVDTDVPMQGPFPEKYVGGRFYRHTALNKGTDTELTRGEGFRINFDNGGSQNIAGVNDKSLVILPPDSPHGVQNTNLPTAYRFREVTTKRPVNIKNIQMRTGSTIIGNYEKNYQVVNSNSRMKNDPFFNDQSFNFALYPETLATRGRFPLFEPLTWAPHALQFGAATLLQAKADVNDAIDSFTSGSFSTSFWMKPSVAMFVNDTQVIVSLGRHSSGGGAPTYYDSFEIRLYNTVAPKVYAEFTTAGSAASTYRISDTNLSSSADTWIHVACVFPKSSMDAGAGSVYPTVYINGAADNSANKGNAAEFGTNFNTSGSAPVLQIGHAIYSGGRNNFQGDLCDVSLWNTALSASHVTALYNSGVRSNVYDLSEGAGGTIPGLVVNYKLGDHPDDDPSSRAYGDVPPLPSANYSARINFAPSFLLGGFAIVPSKPLTAVASLNPNLGNPLYNNTANVSGNLNFLVPMRTGSDSQDNIIVNRYAGSGYEVMSLGYMDPAHEELSVYNALPYHNLKIRNYGLSGNVAPDPLAAKTITVIDQIDKNRGLDQRASLHCGPFGSDAAFGSVPELTYVTTPSWGKTNRNRKRRMYSHATKGEYYTASVYDNLYVQHQIPQSPQQYAWVTASVIPSIGNAPMEFAPPGVLSGTVLNQLVTGSDNSYYGAGFRNNFAKFNDGTMIPPSVDIQSRTSKAQLGTHSGFFSRITNYGEPPWPYVARVDLGTGTVWEAQIGDSGADAKAFTVSAWVYMPAAPTGFGGIIFQAGTHSGGGLRYLAVDGSLKAWIYIDGSGNVGQVKSTAPVFRLNTWHHVVGCFGGGTAGALNLYVDGEPVALTVIDVLSAPTAINSTTNSTLGTYPSTTYLWTYEFPGFMADVAVWGSVSGSGGMLSRAQINKLYNNGSPLNIQAKLPTSLVAWYRFNPAFGDFTNDAVPNQIADNGADTRAYWAAPINGQIRNVVGTAGTNGTTYNLRLRAFSPFQVDQLNNYLNNQNGPYGWPTWKQTRVGETPVARALKKQNYIGQVVPPPDVPKLIRNPQGSMVEVGTVPAKSPNTAVLYYEGPIDSKMGPVDFFFEDNTEDSDVANNMRVQLPYGNSLEYFSNDGLNNRLGLTIDLDKPMIFDTVRDFLVASSLSTVVRYTESMYPSAHNMYRARVRGRPNYSINKIWNTDRATRSTLGGLTGSFGQTEGKLYLSQTGSNSSVWPLDAHNIQGTRSFGTVSPYPGGAGHYGATSSVVPWDGAGQLMNSYSRYSASSGHYNSYGPTERSYGSITPAPTYAWRIPVGLTGALGVSSGANRVYRILAGDVPWTAAKEANKDPYQNYSTWGERASTAMKDGSIIPEFRISQHLRTYYDTHAGNFLTDNITGIYEISGATMPNSSINGFFKTYSNSDFMKYFRVIDSSLNDQRSGDLKIERDRIKLSAQGLIKFLPYKGFYPAERTAEIATIFSQSYGSRILRGATDCDDRNQAFRIFAEPFMSPGILYNTIKSGLAVGSVVLTNTSSLTNGALPTVLGGIVDTSPAYPEGPVYFKKLLSLGTGSSARSAGYHIAKVPFETVQDPATYFSNENLISVGRSNGTVPVSSGIISPYGVFITPMGRIFDTGIWDGGAALPGTTFSPKGHGADVPSITFGTGPYISYGGSRSSLVRLTDPDGGYRYAIDNFLCETTNFFMNGITSLRSNREDQFQTVVSGAVYRSSVRLYRSSATAPDDSRWDMYSRASAFGVPLATIRSGIGALPTLTTRIKPTFSHLLPPYYSGEATAELIYTASYTGQPTVHEILSSLSIRYRRAETVPNYSASVACPDPGINKIIPADITAGSRPGYAYPGDKTGGRLNDPRMQIDSSFNLKEKIQEVAKGTNTQINYWLIQSKFETPILNFANLTQSQPPDAIPGSLVTNQRGPNALKTIGMWHQYGSPITASNAGVFVEITDQGGNINSLADVVGFQKGVTVRVGDPKKNAILEEAVVVVPFRVNNDQRQFFSYTGTARETTNYANVEVAMKKYVFPPKFDFVRTGAALEAAQERLDDLIAAGVTRAGVTASGKRRLALQNAVNKAANEASLVQPVLMYVFEFGVEIDENDIADMWQNLPPSIDEKMQSSTEVIIEDRELLRVMAANNEDIQWMVFKVKKRAKRDFDIYKRSLVTTDTSALAPKLRGPYTYNWPYDYFSLVELATIDATVQWTSGDMQYELEHDDSIVLDGRPPLRGTRGAPVVPTPTMVHRPGLTMMGAAVGPPGKNMKTKPSSRSARKQAAEKKSSKKAANRSARVRRPTASPAQSRRRRQSTRDPANRSTRNNRSRRNRRGRRGSGGRGSGRGGNY